MNSVLNIINFLAFYCILRNQAHKLRSKDIISNGCLARTFSEWMNSKIYDLGISIFMSRVCIVLYRLVDEFAHFEFTRTISGLDQQKSRKLNVLRRLFTVRFDGSVSCPINVEFISYISLQRSLSLNLSNWLIFLPLSPARILISNSIFLLFILCALRNQYLDLSHAINTIYYPLPCYPVMFNNTVEPRHCATSLVCRVAPFYFVSVYFNSIRSFNYYSSLVFTF